MMSEQQLAVVVVLVVVGGVWIKWTDWDIQLEVDGSDGTLELHGLIRRCETFRSQFKWNREAKYTGDSGTDRVNGLVIMGWWGLQPGC